MTHQPDDAAPGLAPENTHAQDAARAGNEQDQTPRARPQTGDDILNDTLVEIEAAGLSPDGVVLATRLLRRIVEIERSSGADVAEAVIERLIDVFEGRRKLLS
jgi:hypothetical protein